MSCPQHGRSTKQEETVAEMVTELAMTQVFPFRDRLCLDRLADRGPVQRPRLEHGLHPGHLALP